MSELRFCAIGDSIVQGIGDETCAGWPARLAAAETARGHVVTVYNLGIRGDTSDRIARRWRAEVEMRARQPYPFALVFASTYNDTEADDPNRPGLAHDESVALMARTIAQVKSHYRLLWLGAATLVGPPLARAARNEALNVAFAAKAAELGVPFLDVRARLRAEKSPERLTWERTVRAGGDGHHPTGEGYQLIADLVGAWPAWRALLDAPK
jgi:lysophospholipase L1-like esterase